MSENEARAVTRKAWNAARKETDPKRKKELLQKFREARSRYLEIKNNA